MAKLGYTWYPKDWGNSESVFELTLIERGLYRELIDMAMLSDNKTTYNAKMWARKFGSSEDEIEGILITLQNLKLIELKGDLLFIPSCESRLNLVRGGSKGGKKSKPTIKPTTKPMSKPTTKPTSKQKKRNIKEIEIPSFDLFLSYAKDQKPKVDENLVKLKYDSWVINEWKDGNGNSIINWKSKLNNTLPYIAEKDIKPKYIPLKF